MEFDENVIENNDDGDGASLTVLTNVNPALDQGYESTVSPQVQYVFVHSDQALNSTASQVLSPADSTGLSVPDKVRIFRRLISFFKMTRKGRTEIELFAFHLVYQFTRFPRESRRRKNFVASVQK